MKLIGLWLVYFLTVLLDFISAKGHCQIAVDSDVVNTPTTYTFTFRPGSPNLQQSAMKFTFSKASYMYPTIPVSCQPAGNTAVYYAMGCQSYLAQDPYVIVTGLKPSQFQYQVEITSIINGPSEKLITDVFCEFCNDNGCNSISEVGDYSQITFRADNLTAADISIRSTKFLNGETDATLEFGILLSHRIIPSGTITLDIPKQNYWFYLQGGPNRQCMVQDCNAANLETRVAIAEADVAIQEFPVQLNSSAPCIGQATKMGGVCFIDEYIDDMHDRVQINLANPVDIPATWHVRIYMYPIQNPPSTAPLSTFSGFTGDYQYNPSEQFQGMAFDTTLPNEWVDRSSAAIVGSTQGLSTNYNVVSTTGLIYNFLLYTGYNDIPWYSKITVGWPDDWLVDCSNTYTVQCSDGCSFDGTPFCDTAKNRLELLNGFLPTGTFPYIQHQVGKIEFTISGITNPDTDTGKYFTMTSWHNESNTFYEIDSSYQMFYVEFTTGSVLIKKVLPTDPMIYSKTGFYYFEFAPQHQILTDMILTITFPLQLQVQQNALCTIMEVTTKDGFGAFTTKLQSGYTCKADANNNLIVLQDFLLYDSQAGDTIVFLLNSIRNPGDFSKPGTLYMDFKTTLGGRVDSGSYNNWVDGLDMYNTSFIETFTVTADNLMAGQNDVTYIFNLKPHFRVIYGAFLQLDLPRELEVDNSNQLSRGCLNGNIEGFSYQVLTCTYNQVIHEVSLKNGFKFAFSDGDPPELYFTLTNFRNPRSTAPTEMFNITIFSTFGNELFYFNSSVGPMVQMTSAPEPNSISYERSDYTNGLRSNYSWYIVTSNNIIDGDIMRFELPTGIRFTDNSKAIGLSINVEGEMEAILTGDRQEILITMKVSLINAFRRRRLAQIDGGSIIRLMLTEVTSPISFRPLDDTIHYHVTDKDGYSIEEVKGNLEVLNRLMGRLDPAFAGVQPDYWENNILTNYTLGFSFNNYEQNLKIFITIPPEIGIPTEEELGGKQINCRGIKGTDRAQLTCEVFYDNRTIMISDAVTSKEVAPAQIELAIESLKNPSTNIITQSFIIETRTYDGYQVDLLEEGLEVNFYCIFPCRDCIEETPNVCLSCYTTTSSFRYLWDKTCLEECPNAMYVINNDTQIPTCDFCEFPCQNCVDNATDCQDCYPGFIHYEEERICYEEIFWYFPFLQAAGIFFFMVFIIDYYKRQTNFLHALLFFLSWVENAVIFYLILLYRNREIGGNRQITIMSIFVDIFLNVVFAFMHLKFIIGTGTVENQQQVKNYPWSTYGISTVSYILNFKMTILLISHFGGYPRLAGKFDRNAWQKFNIFGLLYIVFVYMPFITDFYLYFTTYGLRKVTSFVGAEACIVRTIIALILMLELLSQCACAGLQEYDLAERVGGFQEKGEGKGKKRKKKRKASRSGAANEAEYYQEYESEEESWDEEEAIQQIMNEDPDHPLHDMQLEQEEEEEEVVNESEVHLIDSELEKKTPKPKIHKNIKKDERLDQLEMLAMQMKNEKDALEAEQNRILDEKMRLIQLKEEKLMELNIAEQLQENRDTVKQDLQQTVDDVDAKIMEKLAEMDRDALVRHNKNPTLILPQPIQCEIEYSRSVSADDQYWIENISPYRIGEISDEDKEREKEDKTIEYIERISARMSKIDSIREIEADEEMRADNESQGALRKSDLTKSYRASESIYNVGNASAVFNNSVRRSYRASETIDGVEDATGLQGSGAEVSYQVSQSLLDINNSSAVFEEDQHQSMQKSTFMNTQEDIQERGRDSSVEFNEVREEVIKETQVITKAVTPTPKDNKTGFTPRKDRIDGESGVSGESDEGVVADHRPFNGIKQEMERSGEELRRSMELRLSQQLRNERNINETNIVNETNINETNIVKHKKTSRYEHKTYQEDIDHNQNINFSQKQTTTKIKKNFQSVINKSIDSLETNEELKEGSPRKRVKQVIWSDKSESSVEELMQDTPSNYNIANGRLDGQSMGLKAIMMYAKNQGIQLGERSQRNQTLIVGNTLDTINEAGENRANTQMSNNSPHQIDSSQHQQLRQSLQISEGGEWKSMSRPMHYKRSSGVQIAAKEEIQSRNISKTIDYQESVTITGHKTSKVSSKRHPGFKQFIEVADDQGRNYHIQKEISKVQKNNFTQQ